ncbi:DoxX family protein [Geofilum rubicundum]|uniref:DoxX family protein n=1 Tax=Geofilum rubicundum JCM 15548 TaxID=1236989 RepID=A0A0E9M0B9_9BACT|nr:DoxX family protein [Geofilum rubicundum]GAO30575.1 DoxX family protein [Geofilum rubicundum JCM 15548]
MKVLLKNEKDLASLILRAGLGFFMAFGHGLGKLQMLISGDIQFAALFGLSPTINLTMAVLAEFFAALLVLVGLKTRLAALPVIITMAVAVFIVHFSDPLFAASGGGSKEFAAIYLIGYLGIFLLGSGKYSLDALIGKK